MTNLEVEPRGHHDTDPCDCCGNLSRVVGGLVHDPTKAVASYYVHWTLASVDDHGANFDLIIGPWDDDASASDRILVSLDYQVGRGFTVIDAGDRPPNQPELVGKALARDDVIGTETAKLAFQIVDAIWLQEPGIAEIVDTS